MTTMPFGLRTPAPTDAPIAPTPPAMSSARRSSRQAMRYFLMVTMAFTAGCGDEAQSPARGADVPPATDTSARAAQGWRDIVKKYVNPRVAPYRDVTAETRDIGVYGSRAVKYVARAMELDENALAHLAPYSHVSAPVEGGKAIVISVAEIEVPGFEIIMPAAAEASLREKLLSLGAIPGSATAYDIARVEAGWPEWGIDMNDTTIPQEANFDSLGAISYTKGCYTGQETVARVHFRGHVNKFLRRLHFVSAAVPPMNAELVDDSGAVVGDIRSVALSPRQGGVAIAMVRREVAPGTTLHARWEGGECTVQIAAHEKGATG